MSAETATEAKPTRLEELCGLRGTEPDTVVARFVPRAAELPCGRDAIGSVLSEGEDMICLCCGATTKARLLTADERKWGEGFDHLGSSWVRVRPWLAKILDAALQAVAERDREWCAAMPRCNADAFGGCVGKVATRRYPLDGSYSCDTCDPELTTDLPWAALIRRATAGAGEGGE